MALPGAVPRGSASPGRVSALYFGAPGGPLFAARNSCGLDVAQFPGQQHTHEQQDRKAHTKSEGASHVVCLGLAVASILQHEVQGRAQACQDGYERNNNEVDHGAHYPVSLAIAPARFWLLTVATVLAFLATLSLGFWQLSRAAQKTDLQSAIDNRRQMAVLDAAGMSREAANPEALHRRVVLRGSWLGQHTVFLDNRQMNATPGFFVITPLQLENRGATVVVQRGWVQRNFGDRASLPVVPTPDGVVQLEGRIAPPPSKLYEFRGADSGVIRQNLDMQRYAKDIGVALLPVSVLQMGVSTDSLLRDWPRLQTGVAKHYGYAFQWFALSGLIAFLYVWFQVVRRPR